MKELYVTKYGLAENISTGVIAILKDANDGDTIVFPKDEYHFYKDFTEVREYHTSNTDSFRNPKKNIAFLIENKKNLTIDGNGSKFIIHGNIMALCVAFCENITLKNFTVDYYCPTDVEMKVKSVNKNKVTFSIPKHNLWSTDGKNMYFFEISPFTKQNYWEFKNYGEAWCEVKHTNDYVCRVIPPKAPLFLVKSAKRINETDVEITYFIKRNFNVGDVFTLSQNKFRNTAGIFFWESKNIVSENININYLQGFGWLTQMCENVSFDNIKFVSNEDRKTTSFADCIHIAGAKGQVDINNCYFSNSHDDGINIHGTFMRVKERMSSSTIKLEYVHSQQGGFQQYHIGDKVAFYYRDTLKQDGSFYTVTNVINPFENELTGKETIVTFDKDLPSDIDSNIGNQKLIVAENVTYCPDVNITNCKFELIPTRGILCTSSGKVNIKNNYFRNVSMANIYISNDSNEWYESGPVRDITIENNKFDIPASFQKEWKNSPAIFIDPVTKGNKCKGIVHKNIKIFNNEFNVENDRALYAKNTENIVFQNNKMNCKLENKFEYCKKIKAE